MDRFRPRVDAMTNQLRAFLEYLRLNRNASAHTSAAYESDVTQFLEAPSNCPATWTSKRPAPS